MNFQKIPTLHPTEGNEISWWLGGSMRQKKLEEMYEAYLEFPEGWEGVRKNPFLGEVWIFPGITQSETFMGMFVIK